MLVALYAAFGIGVIVIGVSVFTGAMSGSDPDPAKKSASVEPTVTPTPPAATGPTAAERAESARLQQAFSDQLLAAQTREGLAVRQARRAAAQRLSLIHI